MPAVQVNPSLPLRTDAAPRARGAQKKFLRQVNSIVADKMAISAGRARQIRTLMLQMTSPSVTAALEVANNICTQFTTRKGRKLKPTSKLNMLSALSTGCNHLNIDLSSQPKFKRLIRATKKLNALHVRR
ncbi:MAG: hypothetical protein Q8O19_05950, partial [Rectinemataceae bacterium]|nr:hypothetical protein [Rectinemataceae bacterium]